MRVVVLRIGHRPVRDYRVTTHVALVARAFGAEKMLVTNVEDDIGGIVEQVNDRWGGRFAVNEIDSWRDTIKKWKNDGGYVVHLTMYGNSVEDVIDQIRNSVTNLMIVVGAEKVPREVYEISDYNVSIGNQPHSEIAALAVFLDRLFQGKELGRRFNGKMRIIPSSKDKIVTNASVS